MSRGKHGRRRRNRDRHTRAAALAALHERITVEHDRLQHARHAAAQADALRARLERETTIAHQRVAPAEADADATGQRIGPPWQRLHDAITQLRHVDHQLTSTTGHGGHRPTAQAVHARDAGLPIRLTDVHHHAPPGYREHLYQHRLRAGDPEIPLLLHGWVPDDTPTDRDSLAPYALSTIHDHTPEAGWCWAIPPWLNLPDGTDAPQLRAALGATTTGAPTLPPSRYRGPRLPTEVPRCSRT